MNEILTWGLPIFIGLASYGLTYSALQTASTRGDFWMARFWFALGSFVVMARFLYWGVTANRPQSVRVLVCGLIATLLIAATVESFRSIGQKQRRNEVAVSKPEGQARKVEPQEEQLSAPMRRVYDLFIKHSASLGLPEKTYTFYSGPQGDVSSQPIEVKAHLRYDPIRYAPIVGIYVNSDNASSITNGCVAALRHYREIVSELREDARRENIIFNSNMGPIEIYNEVMLSQEQATRIINANQGGTFIEFMGSVPFAQG